jgi:hypothetical protein
MGVGMTYQQFTLRERIKKIELEKELQESSRVLDIFNFFWDQYVGPCEKDSSEALVRTAEHFDISIEDVFSIAWNYVGEEDRVNLRYAKRLLKLRV